MTTQTTPKTPSFAQPAFVHRIDGDITDSLNLTDIISMMTFRAIGVLNLVSVNMDADNRASDEIVKAALNSAIMEIEDIDATIQAFHKAAASGTEVAK